MLKPPKPISYTKLLINNQIFTSQFKNRDHVTYDPAELLKLTKNQVHTDHQTQNDTKHKK